MAGAGVDCILFPLDTIKTRIQSKEGFFKAGSFKRIYNGLPSTLLGSAPTSALFFTAYELTKSKLSVLEQKYQLNPIYSHIAAANVGEVVSSRNLSLLGDNQIYFVSSLISNALFS